MPPPRRIVAFDIAEGVVGTYAGHSRRCAAFRLSTERMSALVDLLYSADVIVTFSGWTTYTDDFDLFHLEKYCEATQVTLDVKRINRNYIDTRPRIWRASQDYWGRALRYIYPLIGGGDVLNLRGMSADPHVRDAQTDAYMAYRVWRFLERSRPVGADESRS